MWWDAAVRHSLGVGGLPIAFDLVEKPLFAAIKICENLSSQKRFTTEPLRPLRKSKSGSSLRSGIFHNQRCLSRG